MEKDGIISSVFSLSKKGINLSIVEALIKKRFDSWTDCRSVLRFAVLSKPVLSDTSGCKENQTHFANRDFSVEADVQCASQSIFHSLQNVLEATYDWSANCTAECVTKICRKAAGESRSPVVFLRWHTHKTSRRFFRMIVRIRTERGCKGYGLPDQAVVLCQTLSGAL